MSGLSGTAKRVAERENKKNQVDSNLASNPYQALVLVGTNQLAGEEEVLSPRVTPAPKKNRSVGSSGVIVNAQRNSEDGMDSTGKADSSSADAEISDAQGAVNEQMSVKIALLESSLSTFQQVLNDMLRKQMAADNMISRQTEDLGGLRDEVKDLTASIIAKDSEIALLTKQLKKAREYNAKITRIPTLVPGEDPIAPSNAGTAPKPPQQAHTQPTLHTHSSSSTSSEPSTSSTLPLPPFGPAPAQHSTIRRAKVLVQVPQMSRLLLKRDADCTITPKQAIDTLVIALGDRACYGWTLTEQVTSSEPRTARQPPAPDARLKAMQAYLQGTPAASVPPTVSLPSSEPATRPPSNYPPLLLLRCWPSRIAEFWKISKDLKTVGLTLAEDLTLQQRERKKTQQADAVQAWNNGQGLVVSWRRGDMVVKEKGSSSAWTTWARHAANPQAKAGQGAVPMQL